MAISFGNKYIQWTGGTAGANLNTSVTITSDKSLLLVCASCTRSSSGWTMSGTYAGLPMTRLAESGVVGSTYYMDTCVFYMIAPPVGTANLTISSSSSTFKVVATAEVLGVNLVDPFTNLQISTPAATAGSGVFNVTSNPGDSSAMIISCLGKFNGTETPAYTSPLIGVSTGQACSATPNYSCFACIAYRPGGLSLPVSWTWGSTGRWNMHTAFALNPAYSHSMRAYWWD